MASQLCFNFINSNHKELPFGCKLRFTDSPDEIVEQFIHFEYLDGIPWSEVKPIETAEEFAEAEKLEKELIENYVLTVYREIITKQKL
ncbi:MAG: hypothetical protein K1X91_12515 [Bacteriodetes bacterium]|nr:hypothetical protein [Bacteroidota bacterium]